MGYEAITAIAGADLSAKAIQFLAIDLSTGVQAASGAAACGIIQNNPKLGEFATLFYLGESECRVGSGGTTKGQRLTVTTSGYFTGVLSGGFSVGRALAACASGGIVRGVFNFANGAVTGA